MTRQLVLVSLVLACCFDLRYAYADKGIDFFEKKIRPVLVQECYRCHSSAKRQRGGLVLDTRAGIRKGGDTGPAVVPGKPEKSLLLTALRYKGDLQMPPRGKLPDEVIADFEKWIAQGAPDPRDGKTVAKHGIDMEAGRKFWAFQPFKKSPLPEVSDVAWPFNDIDRFILARLEAGKIKPGSDADRVTLIRRAYFDLIGLPPPLEKIDAFVNDTSPKAFEKVVDELLASPHFGERWGRHWLDVARFAESTGGGRSLLLKEAWRYRDYVIESFNADKPYNRFVAEQIAGDLLPASSPNERAQNLIATAFLALGPTNYELQDKQVLEVDVIDEQLDTIGRAFLGLTIGCARCHDHKFDPIPTRDYYALAGIFKSTQTLIHDNVSRWVEQPLPLTDKEEAAWKAYLSAEAKLKARIAAAKRAKPSLKGPIAVAHLAGLVYDDISAKQVGVWKKSQYYRSYVGTGYLHDDNADKGQKTVTFVPAFKKAGRYEVRLAYTPGANRATNVPVTILHRDGETNRKVNQRHVPPIDGRFVSLGTYHFDENDQWYVLISNEGTDGYVIVDAVQFLPEGRRTGEGETSHRAFVDR
ncbi:MAG: hypothetical protein KatS3mg105_0007 [Gemmatales bacterium]|nr:MAG: hypothetical protein KatS3mg105_0007 [Gemmatales bacterium]